MARPLDQLDTLIGATCTRVPVIDGHLVNISVELEEKAGSRVDRPGLGAIPRARSDSPILPSAPSYPLQYLTDIDRPQPAPRP